MESLHFEVFLVHFQLFSISKPFLEGFAQNDGSNKDKKNGIVYFKSSRPKQNRYYIRHSGNKSNNFFDDWYNQWDSSLNRPEQVYKTRTWKLSSGFKLWSYLFRVALELGSSVSQTFH